MFNIHKINISEAEMEKRCPILKNRNKYITTIKCGLPTRIDTTYLADYASVIKEGIAVTSIPRCGSSTLNHLHLLKMGVKNEVKKYEPFREWMLLNGENSTKLSSLSDDTTLYCVIRDPAERLVSIWRRVDGKTPFYDFCKKLKIYFNNTNFNDFDIHLFPQTFFINKERVNKYIWLKDLENFLSQLGFEDFYSNATLPEYKGYKVPQEILDFYEDDYNFIKSLKGEDFWDGTIETN